ncbi:DUF2516 family protein [Kineococcus sp. R8]|uniref:DUF2516 family protein n=1 Tax=Kineococcus siccus TaxID=2696567 RepID=UPI0014136BAC|nr:DUF2516 family protein [Kineococcus siccus]
MTSLIGGVQSGVLLVLSVGAFALTLFALVDAVRHKPDAYVAAGKRTKTFWVAIVAVATAFCFVTLGGGQMPGFLSIIGVVAAAVYLADVRPAVRQFRGRGGPRRDDRHQGPYGPW